MLIRWLAICGCLWACNAFSQAPASVDASEIVSNCASRATETGLEALEKSCPGVTDALKEFGVLQLLSKEQTEQLTAEGLSQLESLHEDYSVAQPSGAHQVATQSLQSILSKLQKERPREQAQSWFQRLITWLRGFQNRSARRDSSWLQKFDPSERALQITRWTLIAIVILLALGVVLNELRVAGILRKRRSHELSSLPLGAAVATPALAAKLEDAQLLERPSILLRMIVSELTRGGQLRTERSLTHRELSEQARFATDTQHETFRRLAGLSESLLYGARPISAERINETVNEGLNLHRDVARGS